MKPIKRQKSEVRSQIRKSSKLDFSNLIRLLLHPTSGFRFLTSGTVVGERSICAEGIP